MKNHKRKLSTEHASSSTQKKSKRGDVILNSKRSAFEEQRYETTAECPECVVCSPQHDMVLQAGGESPFDTACEDSKQNDTIVMYKLLQVKSKHNSHTSYVHKSCAKDTKLNLTVNTDNKSCQNWFKNIHKRKCAKGKACRLIKQKGEMCPPPNVPLGKRNCHTYCDQVFDTQSLRDTTSVNQQDEKQVEVDDQDDDYETDDEDDSSVIDLTADAEPANQPKEEEDDRGESNNDVDENAGDESSFAKRVSKFLDDKLASLNNPKLASIRNLVLPVQAAMENNRDSIKDGTITIGFVGMNGIGKSTILDMSTSLFTTMEKAPYKRDAHDWSDDLEAERDHEKLAKAALYQRENQSIKRSNQSIDRSMMEASDMDQNDAVEWSKRNITKFYPENEHVLGSVVGEEKESISTCSDALPNATSPKFNQRSALAIKRDKWTNKVIAFQETGTIKCSERPSLLPVGRKVGTTTSALVHLRYGRRFHAMVPFYSTERAKIAAYQIVALYRDKLTANESEIVNDCDLDDKQYARHIDCYNALVRHAGDKLPKSSVEAKLTSLFKSNKLPSSYSDIVLAPHLTQYLDHTFIYAGHGLDADRDRAYIHNKLAWVMSPIVHSDGHTTLTPPRYVFDHVYVYAPCSLLMGITLMDVPGGNDADQWNRHLTHYAMREADALVVMFEKSLASDNSVQEDLVNSGFIANKATQRARILLVQSQEKSYPQSAAELMESPGDPDHSVEQTSKQIIRDLLTKASVVVDDKQVDKWMQRVEFESVSPMLFSSLVYSHAQSPSSEVNETVMEMTGMTQFFRWLMSFSDKHAVDILTRLVGCPPKNAPGGLPNKSIVHSGLEQLQSTSTAMNNILQKDPQQLNEAIGKLKHMRKSWRSNGAQQDETRSRHNEIQVKFWKQGEAAIHSFSEFDGEFEKAKDEAISQIEQICKLQSGKKRVKASLKTMFDPNNCSVLLESIYYHFAHHHVIGILLEKIIEKIETVFADFSAEVIKEFQQMIESFRSISEDLIKIMRDDNVQSELSDRRSEFFSHFNVIELQKHLWTDLKAAVSDVMKSSKLPGFSKMKWQNGGEKEVKKIVGQVIEKWQKKFLETIKFQFGYYEQGLERQVFGYGHSTKSSVLGRTLISLMEIIKQFSVEAVRRNDSIALAENWLERLSASGHSLIKELVTSEADHRCDIFRQRVAFQHFMCLMTEDVHCRFVEQLKATSLDLRIKSIMVNDSIPSNDLSQVLQCSDLQRVMECRVDRHPVEVTPIPMSSLYVALADAATRSHERCSHRNCHKRCNGASCDIKSDLSLLNPDFPEMLQVLIENQLTVPSTTAPMASFADSDRLEMFCRLFDMAVRVWRPSGQFDHYPRVSSPVIEQKQRATLDLGCLQNDKTDCFYTSSRLVRARRKPFQQEKKIQLA